MARIEWAMWANEQAVASGFVLFVGGLLAVIGQFGRWEIGAYAVALSVFLTIFEYPRSKRAKGNTRQRSFQNIFAPIVKCLGPVGRNYYIRFVFYLLACIPCVFLLSTVLGALCLLITSIIYLRAAIASEHWTPFEAPPPKQEGGGKAITRMRPPSMAPPRMAKPGYNNEGEEPDEMYGNVTVTVNGNRV